METVRRSIKIPDELWNQIPNSNKSEYIRNVLNMYLHNDLVENSDIKALNSENQRLLQLVDAKTQHIEDLQKTIAGLLPAPKHHWWQFWKK